ncbi:TPA: cupin domain-containing protein [Candidatus Poribacteria bacterium]|jgi:mannose-6-phosphate isomerase-like protein (cupin superfamily)|nr:cupin domain-containing protein [Candidatus Poribacteria bacterium]HIA68165.1 cupin domain-containing protein [Candidatus Poribacteria bacterium]HIB92295.1 cupin domain-containing protein [Candidatus Poribacteria bacterium]HIC02329.1 cupin domain-containing protein [Candidatus Poribacteria bacterium]HIM10870.1 cupin domain-containing protein [Candidatus Poribacteria bacterium]
MKAEIRNDIKGIDRFIFENGLDNSKLHMHISEVGPNQSMHAPHQHEGQEIFYVFSGKGEIVFGDQTHILKNNHAILVDCQVPHGIRNVGDVPLRYAVIIAKS